MPFTFTDYATKVLQDADTPLTCREIWEKGYDKNLNTEGKTPWNTLGAKLYIETKTNPKSDFIKVASNPARFFLTSKPLQGNILEEIEKTEILRIEKTETSGKRSTSSS